jgi:hypothetical protein
MSAVTWSQLPPDAKLFRLAHAAFGAVGLTALAHIWLSAVTRRRDRALPLSIGFLAVEGGALVVGRGNCPFGAFQRQLGDPVPLFELVLPPRAAKAAIPVLAVASLGGMAVIAIEEIFSRR